jgi:hypothetical protein
MILKAHAEDIKNSKYAKLYFHLMMYPHYENIIQNCDNILKQLSSYPHTAV